jgi:hypothetical protein
MFAAKIGRASKFDGENFATLDEVANVSVQTVEFIEEFFDCTGKVHFPIDGDGLGDVGGYSGGSPSTVPKTPQGDSETHQDDVCPSQVHQSLHRQQVHSPPTHGRDQPRLGRRQNVLESR